MNQRLPSILREDFRFYRATYADAGVLEVVFDRCFLLCACYRYGYWARTVRLPLIGGLLRLLYVLANVLLSALTGADIRSGAHLGRRLHLHTTFGLVVADGVVVGDDCTLNAGVCLANKANGRGEGQPNVGDGVTFGVGCKVLGGIRIGNHAIVGANAVVLHDVPDFHIAFGVPAKNKPLSADTAGQDQPNCTVDAFGLRVTR